MPYQTFLSLALSHFCQTGIRNDILFLHKNKWKILVFLPGSQPPDLPTCENQTGSALLPIICVNRYSCTIARPDNHSTKHHQQQIPNYHRPDTSNPFHTCPSSSQKLNYPCIFICRQNFIYSLKQNHPLSLNEKFQKNKLIRFHRTKVNLISLFFYNLMSQLIDLTPT